MAKQLIKQSVEGYKYVTTDCCRSRVILNRVDIGLLNSGNSLTRSCSKCNTSMVISGKMERSYADQTLSLL